MFQRTRCQTRRWLHLTITFIVLFSLKWSLIKCYKAFSMSLRCPSYSYRQLYRRTLLLHTFKSSDSWRCMAPKRMCDSRLWLLRLSTPFHTLKALRCLVNVEDKWARTSRIRQYRPRNIMIKSKRICSQIFGHTNCATTDQWMVIGMQDSLNLERYFKQSFILYLLH